jgi:hypothetical protein
MLQPFFFPVVNKTSKQPTSPRKFPIPFFQICPQHIPAVLHLPATSQQTTFRW